MSKDALLATPPAGVSAAIFSGWNLNDLVLFATLVYTLFLLIDKGWTLYQRYVTEKEKRNGESK